MPSPLVTLDRVDVVLGGTTVLDAVSIEIREGESWALLGANGSGKSTLLRLLRGEIWPHPRSAGRRLFHLPEGAQESPIGARERFALVTPEAQDAYARCGWDLPAEAVIRSGFFDQLWPQERATPEQSERIREVAAILGATHLLDRSILQLSRGEARRVLLARALVCRPALLLLDEAADGLDRTAREAFLELIGRVARGGTSVVLATHRAEEIVPDLARVAVIEGGRIMNVGTREEVLSEVDREIDCDRGAGPSPQPSPPAGAGGEGEERGDLDRDREHRPRARVLFDLDRVEVRAGGRTVLRDVTWTMRAGESWAVVGPNGAGKSTLLRLLLGEEQPAAGTIRRLDLGPRAATSAVKARVGHVSPELQARHRFDATGEEVILSGFEGSIGLAVNPGDPERAAAARWIDRLGLAPLAGRRILGLSYGELRKILLARALVHDPEVLLLDEPLAGLDPASRAWTLAALEQLARAGVALVVATHHDDEFPPSVRRRAVLAGGLLAEQGTR